MMNQQRRDGEELVAELVQLGRRLDVPPTPPLALQVRATLERDEGRRRSWLFPPRLGRAVGLALLAGLLLAGVAAAIGFGLPGLRIVTVSELPSPTGGLSAAPGSVEPSGGGPAQQDAERLGLGAPASLDALREGLGFPAALPEAAWLPAPETVLFGEPPPGGQVAVIYPSTTELPAIEETRIGMILTIFRGDTSGGLVTKNVREGTSVEPVDVHGAPGYWISGTPHAIMYLSESLPEVQVVVRLARSTLVWERQGLIYRIESGLTRERAVEVAETLR